MFKSSLDVGSYFIDVQPEDRVEFRLKQDRSGYEAIIHLENVTNGKANVAYFVSVFSVICQVWTSNQSMTFDLENRFGFLREGEIVKVKVTATGGGEDMLERGLFFVKALPLHPDFNVSILTLIPLQIDLME